MFSVSLFILAQESAKHEGQVFILHRSGTEAPGGVRLEVGGVRQRAKNVGQAGQVDFYNVRP